MFRRVAAICALVLAATACTSDDAAAPVASQSSAATTTTATTVPATVPLAPEASPSEAATTFVNAWRDGNHLAALTIALPAAVDAVFAAGDPGPPESRGCNRPPGDGPVLCVYKTRVGELQVRLQPGPAGWIVDQAIVSPA